jgi:hypothetical protein
MEREVRLFDLDAAAALLRQDDPQHARIPFGADPIAIDRMLKVEGIFDRAVRPCKADDQAPVADFDRHRIWVGPCRGHLYFIVRSAIDNQCPIDHASPGLTPSINQQVFEQFVERTFEIAELPGHAALGQSCSHGLIVISNCAAVEKPAPSAKRTDCALRLPLRTPVECLTTCSQA